MLSIGDVNSAAAQLIHTPGNLPSIAGATEQYTHVDEHHDPISVFTGALQECSLDGRTYERRRYPPTLLR